jgi:hypothetical protein
MSQSAVKLSYVVFYGKLKSLKQNEKSVQSKTFSKNVILQLVLKQLERNGDIIEDTTPILQFWSEMQQTWHIYSQRPQNSETGINFFYFVFNCPF